MKIKGHQKGFTLLEILIVLVILAVLAGLAIPAYTTAVEKSRQQEALTGLAAGRESMQRYHALAGTYVGATLPTLDYNLPTANVIQANGTWPLFTYTMPAPAAGTFTITATRVTQGAGGAAIVAGGGTVSISQTGAITRTGVYV